jgi:hypothetical protein
MNVGFEDISPSGSGLDYRGFEYMHYLMIEFEVSKGKSMNSTKFTYREQYLIEIQDNPIRDRQNIVLHI